MTTHPLPEQDAGRPAAAVGCAALAVLAAVFFLGVLTLGGIYLGVIHAGNNWTLVAAGAAFTLGLLARGTGR